ncbi:MAG: peptidoglycan editing factor PgeF [Oscillospiraceae bacterium]|nr:peptidoglycan editing factor PgeF [Oscillospiraceae bacterium]
MSFIKNNVDEIVYMTSSNINTTHAFTTRFGGVSTGIYKSLNLAQRANDDFVNVKENYSLLCSALGISTDNIVCSTQVHGTNVRVVTQDDRCGLLQPNSHQSDGLITNSTNVALMVFTADCVPILLHDPVKKVIGAVHAGWRSAVADITGMAVKKMQSEFGCTPLDIKAAIGPCISKCCFETDADVATSVRDALPNYYDSCVASQVNKFMIDLKEINRIMLSNAGIADISVSDECTSCLSDKYWSHRKTKGQRGSQAALIQL